MWLMVGGLLLNIVMDYVFIFPLGGGGRRGLRHGYRADADCCCRAGLFLYPKTALCFDLQMFKLKPKYLKTLS